MNLDALRERARIVSAIRRFFDGLGFLEVETPVRIAAPAPEEHIDCPPVVDGGYLRASPELQMKKLLAAGLDKIYEIGPCFREGENGSRHSPEFTMIEWYRRDATYLDIKDDLERLLMSLSVSRLSPQALPGEGRETEDERRGFVTLRVRDAYLKYAGWDPWAGDWNQDRFDFDMATKIEPAIKALGGGVFLMDYPPQAASLAKLSFDHLYPRTSHPAPGTKHQTPGAPYAERWEFYWDGLELANCFTELCDGEEQTRRFEKAKAARRELGEADYPIDREFLAELPKIGRAAGVALGVDRLVMVLTGLKDIHQVRVAD